ncbi:MAG: cupin domain-containing protein [Pseudoxanthomonas sp.]
MPSALPPFKRVVTGHDADGRAIISQSGAPPQAFASRTLPGTVFHEIWKTRATPAPVDNGADPTLVPLQMPPPPHGSAVRVVDIPPDSIQERLPPEQMAAHFAEMGGAHAGQAGTDPRHRFMHRTETIDYGIVVAGKVWLVLDEDEIELSPGDIVVQRGTNHAWSNRTESVARMMFVLLDGRFALP